MNYDNLNGNNLKSRSKSSLFLMELIIVLMFFSLCAATCMQIFANAKVKTDYSRDLTNAAFAAESVAEVYKALDGDLEATASKCDGEAVSDGVIEIYYDKDWNPTAQDGAVYVMTVTETETEDIEKAFIEVDDVEGENIFDIVSTVLASAATAE